MASPTTIAPVIAPNFLSGTTDTTYQLHLASDLHNQALIEATTDASYAILRFKTPTQNWALALGGDTSPTDPSGSFYLFDNTDAIAPLWTVTPGTGNTTIKGIVSAQGHEATGNIDIAGMPLGSIALDVAYPIGRLSSKSVNPELGGIQLIGVDNTGRLFTYLGCAEPTVGNQVVAIYAPLQLSAGIDSDVSISGTLDVAGKLTAEGDVGIYGSLGVIGALSVNGPTQLGGGLAGPLELTGDLDVTGNLSAANLHVTGDTIMDGKLTAEGDVGIYGSLGVIGALSVNGPTQLGGGLAGPLELTGDLDVTGNLSAANLHVTGDTIMDGNLQAERADFTGCFVNGSEVLTAADLPPVGIPYPPPGLGISTGSAWEEESIDPATVPRTNTPNTFTDDQTFEGYAVFERGISVTGFVPQAPDVSNFSAGGGTAYIDSCGPDASTRGALSFRLFSSTGGFGITPLLLDSAGNATFAQNVVVTGFLSVTGEKTFLVPHPLIEGSDLVHACLEGPENGVFYRGEVETTITGQAEVLLPDYFEALTFDDDRSVLLTQVLESDDEKLALLAATRILDGRFHIRSSEGFVRVAWEVKAVRRVGVDRLDVIRDSKEMKQ